MNKKIQSRLPKSDGKNSSKFNLVELVIYLKTSVRRAAAFLVQFILSSILLAYYGILLATPVAILAALVKYILK